MRGYTAKKGNRYYAVICEGVDPATGKERRRWYPAGTRKTDADKLVTELVKRRNDGDYRAPEKITLGAYLTEKWLPAQRSQLKHSTFDSYRRTIELHVLPTLGQVPLGRVLPEDLDALYARLLDSGRRNGTGGGLSPASVRYVHRILRKALNDALRKGSISRNPAATADPPRRAGTDRSEQEMQEVRQPVGMRHTQDVLKLGDGNADLLGHRSEAVPRPKTLQDVALPGPPRQQTTCSQASQSVLSPVLQFS